MDIALLFLLTFLFGVAVGYGIGRRGKGDGYPLSELTRSNP